MRDCYKRLRIMALALALLWGLALPAAAVPRFEDYPAPIAHNRKPVELQLRSAHDRHFRTELRRAWQQEQDFAEQYVLWKIGCGMQCVQIVAVSKVSGQVAWLPGSLCCWYMGLADDDPRHSALDYEPVRYRMDSRFLVVDGLINEAGENKTRYYQIINGRGFAEITDQESRHAHP